MQDLKAYTVQLIKNGLINVRDFTTQRDNTWVITKPFAGIQADTVFNGEVEMYDRLATALVGQYQNGALRLVS
jgi:hypothetical protein